MPQLAKGDMVRSCREEAVSIPDAIGKSNLFLSPGGGNSAVSLSGAGTELKFADFARLVANDEPSAFAGGFRSGDNVLFAGRPVDPSFDRSLLQGLIALQREGDFGRLLAAAVPGILPQEAAIALSFEPAVLGLSEKASDVEEISLDFSAAKPGEEVEPGEEEYGNLEESGDGADLLPVAVTLNGVVSLPQADGGSEIGEAFVAGTVAVSPPAPEIPETLPDGGNDAATPVRTGALAGQGLPVPDAGSDRVADNAASATSQVAAGGPAVQSAPLSIDVEDKAPPALQGAVPAVDVDSAEGADLAESFDSVGDTDSDQGAGKATPANLSRIEGSANLFGQARAAEVRSEKAEQALAKAHGQGLDPAGNIEDSADESGETTAVQNLQQVVGKTEPAVQPTAVNAGLPLVSSLSDPRLKAEAAIAEAENAEGEDSADVTLEGEERKAEKSKVAEIVVDREGGEGKAPRRSGVSGAALAFAAAVRSGSLEGAATDGAAFEAPDTLGFQSALIDVVAVRQAPQATQQLPHAAQVAPQVAAQIARHTAQGNSRFQIRLHPEELGGVDVELKITSDGVVKAHLTVERSETLDLFLRDQRGLERALDAAGLKVDSDTLQFSLKDQGNSQFFAQGEKDSQFAGKGGDERQSSAADQGDAQPASSAGRAYVRGASGALDVQV